MRSALIYILMMSSVFGPIDLLGSDSDQTRDPNLPQLTELLRWDGPANNDHKISNYLDERKKDSGLKALSSIAAMMASIYLINLGIDMRLNNGDGFISMISGGLGVIGTAFGFISGMFHSSSFLEKKYQDRLLYQSFEEQGFNRPALKFSTQAWLLGMVDGKARLKFLVYHPQNLEIAKIAALKRLNDKIRELTDLESANSKERTAQLNYLNSLVSLLEGQTFERPKGWKFPLIRKAFERSAIKRLKQFFMGIVNAKMNLTGLGLDPNLIDLEISPLVISDKKHEITFASNKIKEILEPLSGEFIEVTSEMTWQDSVNFDLHRLRWDQYPVSFDGRSEISGRLSVILTAKIVKDGQERIMNIPLSFEEGSLGLNDLEEIQLTDLARSRGFESAFRSALRELRSRVSPTDLQSATIPDCNKGLVQVAQPVRMSRPTVAE